MHTEPTDMDIIGRVLQGDANAYAGLVERYQNFVFTIVLRYVKSREDAEEVAQDVFVKAYRALADFKGTSKFSTWLYTITTTTSISALRKKKLDVQSLDNEKVFQTVEHLDGGMKADAIEQKSRAVMVHNAIKLLSSDDAQVITLFYKRRTDVGGNCASDGQRSKCGESATCTVHGRGCAKKCKLIFGQKYLI
jgi:RNA polymerase sigma-70 factor (ECF subfamily)